MSDPVKPPMVLVLDDEKNIRKSLEIVLEQEGLAVVTAHVRLRHCAHFTSRLLIC